MARSSRHRILAAALAAFLLAASPAAATSIVKIADNSFAPKTKIVARNTTIKWRWVGSNPHDVRVFRGPAKFSSKVMSQGSYSRKLTRPGTYRLFCSVHTRFVMSQKIVVRR